MIFRPAVYLLMVLWPVSISQAGNWHILSHDERSALIFTGPISEGDAENLVSNVVARKDVKLIIFDSPGGDLVEGIRLAEAIEHLKLDTMILRADECESACAVAFMGGIRRIGQIGAKLGIHAPYRVKDAAPYAFLDAEGIITRDLGNLGYRRIITRIASRRGISANYVELMFKHEDTQTTKEIDVDTGIKIGIFNKIVE